MKVSEFKKVKFFTPDEKWGDLAKIDPMLVYRADAERKQTNNAFVVHCAYDDSGHSDKSYHYKGQALDGHYENMQLLDQFLLSERSNLWGGIGIYPFWDGPGLHRDLRAGFPLRWIRDKTGKYLYNPTIEQIINIMKLSKNPLCKIKGHE